MDYKEWTEEEPFNDESEAALRQIVLDRAPASLARLATALDDAAAFIYLPAAAAAAFHLGYFADARQLADRALELAPAFVRNWNYGNALHIGHTVLGLLALSEQDCPAAINRLYLSGETPGSPQLDTFGPTMQLAKELLIVGQVEPVLAYLKQCRAFWKMGEAWLDLWEGKVREGRIPNFFQHRHV